VIEWDQLADSIENETLREEVDKTTPLKRRRWSRAIAIGAGALGAAALAGWGIHRLRS
jgi:ferric-dicitrate binding protein FerR (iron transport regulator)